MRLCVCQSCEDEYGSCELFQEYPLMAHGVNHVQLRSEVPSSAEIDDEIQNADFISPDSVVAILADAGSMDTVWFIKVIKNECISNGKDTDDYGHSIIAGARYITGNFPERTSYLTAQQVFRLSKKVTFFYKESVVYPFVNIIENKKGFVLKNKDSTDIIHFIEQNGFSHI